MKHYQGITLSAVALILIACSSPKFGTAEYAEIQEQQRQKMLLKQVEQTIDKSPKWFLEPPVESNAIYSVATDYSTDLQFAIDKSMLNAKVGLATQISNKVSSKMKEFAQEVGAGSDAQVVKEIERVSTELVTEVNLSGFTTAKREIIQQGSGYRSYVMLRYPLGEANKMVVEQTKKNAILDSKIRASKAFQELEKDIADSKKD
jgi:hypothetical protein